MVDDNAALGAGRNALTAPPSPPPHPLDAQWYMHVNGETFGPYSGHQLGEYLKEGRVDAATQVAAVGSENWIRIGEEPRLLPILRQKQPPSPPVTAAAGATVVQVTNNLTPQIAMIGDDLELGTKSPGVAVLLSFFFCGAGQMYCGRVGRGFAFLFGCIAAWMVLLGWAVSIWAMFDAYNLAKKRNLRYLRQLQAVQLR